MRRDNLEHFILTNREAFDMETPSARVWAGIDRAIHPRPARRIQIWRALRVAAAVVALLVCGASIGFFLSQSRGANTDVLVQAIAPEFLEMEAFFKQQVEQKMRQLTNYKQKDAIISDLQQIDKTVEELKAELFKAPRGKEEDIIQNLIQNYQTKILILERILERTQSTNPQFFKPAENEISI
jgi:hypothetical protein